MEAKKSSASQTKELLAGAALTARKLAKVLSISEELLPLASTEREDFSGVSPSSSSLSA